MPLESTVLLGIAVAGILSIISPTLGSELDAHTSSGPVHGFYYNSAETVRSFLGIPYAESPTGDLRFKPPVRKVSSQDVINATAFGPTCPGVYTWSNESIWSVLPYLPWNVTDMADDCLSINIWAPAGRHQNNDAAAVMMYIYGGGFSQGSTAIAFYDGSKIVEDHQDIIVVTFNYRISVFGYPNSPDLPADKQNVGLLDQRLAVQWVHDNIANFGGDPSRIMLFGQSAGAASTDMYAYAYPDDPLVHAFTIESGAANMPITSNDTTRQNWNTLTQAVGCGPGNGSLGCMQKKPFDRILSKMGETSFLPVPDNVTVFTNYTNRANEGKVARVPTLIGGNKREGSAYFPLSSSDVDEQMQFAGTQRTFNCPILETARLRREQNIPTWRYLYHGNWTNLSPVPWLGAYHSSEVPMVFGSYNKTTVHAPPSQGQVQFSKYIQGAWASFAKDPQNGLKKYGWPEYNPRARTLINLAFNNNVAPMFTSGTEWDSHCEGGTYTP